MKSKFLAILLICLFVFLSCAGCNIGNYYDNNRKDPVTDPDKPVDPDNPDTPVDDKHYTVTVYLNNAPYEPEEGVDVTVVWRNNGNVKRVSLGKDGKADAGELDGTYSVYLTGLPSEYTHNPNGYVATSQERNVSVLLYSVSEPLSGNGSDMYTGLGCYSVRDDGAYRVKVTDAKSRLFYEFKPRSAGVYVIESWVNIYDDSLNPKFDLYSDSTASKQFSGTLDGGGASMEGGFCKNFLYKFAISANEVGGVCTFALGAESKTGQYPTYYDFSISYQGPYTSSYSDIRPQSAKEAKGKTVERKTGEQYVYANMGTNLYDASKFKLSPNTGKYHVYDMDKYGDNPYGFGKGFGPYLLCDIRGSLPSYKVVDSLYTANSVEPNGSNYLIIWNAWLEEEQKFVALDYTNFIRDDYNRVCNSEGKCFVTEELRGFLQKFAENHSLYTDGVCPGENTPEDLGYSANQDALWLFACGFYQ